VGGGGGGGGGKGGSQKRRNPIQPKEKERKTTLVQKSEDLISELSEADDGTVKTPTPNARGVIE
jgi:hypothetical protein